MRSRRLGLGGWLRNIQLLWLGLGCGLRRENVGVGSVVGNWCSDHVGRDSWCDDSGSERLRLGNCDFDARSGSD